MPVFDFSGASDKKPGVQSECTYTTFQSNEKETSPEKPIMVLDNSSRQWKHHSCGVFTNPVNRTAFDFKEEDGNHTADVVKSVGSRKDEDSIARHLYTILREFDDEGVTKIYSEGFSTEGFGQAIMNRLLKAAGHKVVKL